MVASAAMRHWNHLILLGLAAMFAMSIGCIPRRYDPAKATRNYPAELGQVETVNMQVFQLSHSIRIVNASPQNYSDFDLWINQRYMVHVDSLEAGQSIEISMNDMWDVRGDGPNPGGWFRWYDPTPIRLVQIQADQESPLIGLVAILPEDERED